MKLQKFVCLKCGQYTKSSKDISGRPHVLGYKKKRLNPDVSLQETDVAVECGKWARTGFEDMRSILD